MMGMKGERKMEQGETRTTDICELWGDSAGVNEAIPNRKVRRERRGSLNPLLLQGVHAVQSLGDAYDRNGGWRNQNLQVLIFPSVNSCQADEHLNCALRDRDKAACVRK